MTANARVTQLRAYPVKSMDAAPLEAADVSLSGLEGDRGWAVVGPDGDVVSARQAPSLRDVTAGEGPGGPFIELPGGAGQVAWADADAALSSYVGSPVRLAPAPGEGRLHQVAAVHLVSRQAVAAAMGTTSEDPACDVEAPRANVTVDLGDDLPVGLERAWVGRLVEVGDVVLRVTKVPQHCLGVYAEVVLPGRINLGDPVRPRG